MKHAKKHEYLEVPYEVRDPKVWADIKSGRVVVISVGGQAQIRLNWRQRLSLWWNVQVGRLLRAWKRVTRQ